LSGVFILFQDEAQAMKPQRELNNQVVRDVRSNRLALDIGYIVVPAYLVAIAAAEAIGVFIGVVLSTLCYGLLILVLLNHYALGERASYRRILPILALAPLLSILSLILPVKQVPQIYWYAMVGVPVLMAVALTARLLGLSWTSLGLRVTALLPQVMITLHGIPLGLAGFLIARPEPLLPSLEWQNIAIGSAILFIFVGFTEEIIFRGLLQQVTVERFGRAGMLYSSILFAAMYIGSLSPSYVIFMGLVGLFFSWCVYRTGSIWGVALAHGIMMIGMLLLWPFFWP
jgi:membrane protease YdiL (CAAX protease family)